MVPRPSGRGRLPRARLEGDGVVAARVPLEVLSRTWRVIGCDEESHVMYSASSEWQRGREV
jgi:hypothetical protein